MRKRKEAADKKTAAVTKLISSLGQDQTLHNVNEMTKGDGTLMENFDSNRFNHIDEIAKNIEELTSNIADPTNFDIDSIALKDPFAGSKCPAY